MSTTERKKSRSILRILFIVVGSLLATFIGVFWLLSELEHFNIVMP